MTLHEMEHYAQHDDGARDHDDADRLRDERAELGCAPCTAECCEQGVRWTRDEHGRESVVGWCEVCEGSGYAPPTRRLPPLRMPPDLRLVQDGEDAEECPW